MGCCAHLVVLHVGAQLPELSQGEAPHDGVRVRVRVRLELVREVQRLHDDVHGLRATLRQPLPRACLCLLQVELRPTHQTHDR